MATQAENQAKVKFSYKKYYSFRNRINATFPERFHSDMQIEFVSRTLFYGDTQPAVILSTNPLQIAAYSDEMDAVIVLSFPPEFVEKYNLVPGMRLTTSNMYFTGNEIAKDIFVGKNYCNHYVDFVPIVQLFLGKKDDKILAKTELFSEETWSRVMDQAQEYLREHPNFCRDGFFYFKK